MSKEPPRQKDEKPDLLEQMIRNGPPPTLDAIAEHVADYMVALEAIKEECADDPLLAAERCPSALLRHSLTLLMGLAFDRSNLTPARFSLLATSRAASFSFMPLFINIVMTAGHKPINLAYRDALDRLRALIAPENSGNARQILLKKTDELAGLFGSKSG